jgi:hypothetical protein
MCRGSVMISITESVMAYLMIIRHADTHSVLHGNAAVMRRVPYAPLRLMVVHSGGGSMGPSSSVTAVEAVPHLASRKRTRKLVSAR